MKEAPPSSRVLGLQCWVFREGSEGDFRRVDVSLMGEMDVLEDVFCAVGGGSDVVLVMCLLLTPPLRRVLFTI